MNQAYNYWAVLALEIFMIIMWLASMGALAAWRAAFVTVDNSDCFDCFKKRSPLSERDIIIASQGYLGLISGSAGISAIIMYAAYPLNFTPSFLNWTNKPRLLFVVTLTVHSIYLKRYRSSRPTNTLPTTNVKLEGHPMSPMGNGYNAPQAPHDYNPQFTPTPPPQQVYTPPPQPQPYQPPTQQHNAGNNFHEVSAQTPQYTQVQSA